MSARYVPPSARGMTNVDPSLIPEEYRPHWQHFISTHIVYLTTYTLSDQEVGKIFRGIMEKAIGIIKLMNPDDTLFDANFKVCVPKRKDFANGGREIPLGFAYVWVIDPRIFNVIVGRNPDGSKRQYEIENEDAEMDYDAPIDNNMNWADYAESMIVLPDISLMGRVEAKLTPQQIDDAIEDLKGEFKVNLDRLGNLDMKTGIFDMKPRPSIALKLEPSTDPSKNFDPSTLISRESLPKGLTLDDLRERLQPFSTKGEIRITQIPNGRVMVHFDKYNGDGYFAYQMLRVYKPTVIFPNGEVQNPTMIFDRALVREHHSPRGGSSSSSSSYSRGSRGGGSSSYSRGASSSSSSYSRGSRGGSSSSSYSRGSRGASSSSYKKDW